MILLRIAGEEAAAAPGFGQLWAPILMFYGVSAAALVVVAPLLYLFARIGKRLDHLLGIASKPGSLTIDEYHAAAAQLRQTLLRRGLVIAGVFDAFATAFALLYVIAYSQDHPSLYGAPVYLGVALLAAAVATILWIAPLGGLSYLTARADLRRRMRRQSEP
jgi:hypothetical protein